MADAESNLVPSEAADQVEVALEEQAAADDGILYLNEYQYCLLYTSDAADE